MYAIFFITLFVVLPYVVARILDAVKQSEVEEQYKAWKAQHDLDVQSYINPDVLAYYETRAFAWKQCREQNVSATHEFWDRQLEIRRRQLSYLQDWQIAVAFKEIGRRKAAGEAPIAPAWTY